MKRLCIAMRKCLFAFLANYRDELRGKTGFLFGQNVNNGNGRFKKGASRLQENCSIMGIIMGLTH